MLVKGDPPPSSDSLPYVGQLRGILVTRSQEGPLPMGCCISENTNSFYNPLPWVNKVVYQAKGPLSVSKRVHLRLKALPVGKQGGSSSSQGPTPIGWLRGLSTSRGSRYRADLGISTVIKIQAFNLRTIMKLYNLRINAFKSLLSTRSPYRAPSDRPWAH